MANQFGQFLLPRGAYAQAEPVFRRALAIREKALGPEHPRVAWTLNYLGVLYHAQGQFCGPAVGVTGDSLSGFKGAVIFGRRVN